MVALTVGSGAGAIGQLSFDYEEGQPGADAATGIRTHEAELAPVAGKVFAYATFEMIAQNPIPYATGEVTTAHEGDTTPGYVMPEDQSDTEAAEAAEPPQDRPRGRQFLELGQTTNGEFAAAVRLGIHDGRGLPKDKGLMNTFLFDGELEYYGMRIRPNTPYDFRIHLDLAAQRMTVSVSGRGEDHWYLFAENAPLINPVTEINAVRAEQYPGASGISEVVVTSQPWLWGERVRKHPLAKKERVVDQGKGFKFQPMRSLWHLEGRHVTVAREHRSHMGFPDVAQAEDGTLVCVFNNRSHTGSQGGSAICYSTDLGQTWSEPQPSPGGGRIQLMKDNTLLLAGPDYYTSADGGRTWDVKSTLDQAKAGGSAEAPGPRSHIAELSDGSWLVGGSSYPGGKPWTGTEGEQLEFYRSTDQGQSWQFVSKLQPYPPHSICEPSILVLPEGRLAVYAREDRNDGFQAIKAFSSDNGKTWEVEDLPFPLTGRVCAKFLNDGRVMVTCRHGVGRSGLWAWIGDLYDHTPFRAVGVHHNDRYSVGLKDGALHIDSDGMRGQFTQYWLRQPDSPESTVDITVEVKVVANSGRAASVGIPMAGNLRIFPDHVVMSQNSSLRVEVTPGEFHTYRVISGDAQMKLYVDGELVLETDRVDTHTHFSAGWSPTKSSTYRLAFGNENKCAEATGYSIWRRVEVILDDPKTAKQITSWSAARDGFPDQHQLDHIIEVDASAQGWDTGYSGWVELDDGRIFVVNYTDDAAPTVKGGGGGIPWIRGTYLLPSDLPPAAE